jgi:hypothetical protein
MRQCAQCKTPDREIKREGEASEHFVVPEIRYLSGKLKWDEKFRKQGWVPRAFQGRDAMERMTCRNCLVSNALRDRVWGDMRTQANRMEKPADENAEYYRNLCEA